jgi:hypothetical protein
MLNMVAYIDIIFIYLFTDIQQSIDIAHLFCLILIPLLNYKRGKEGSSPPRRVFIFHVFVSTMGE